MASRGIGGMREMVARKRAGKRLPGKSEKAETPDESPDVDSLDVDGDDVLEDQGDGAHVIRRGRSKPSDRESRDLPDKPPPGWCES